MRANISDELLDMINEKIYVSLEIHVLNKRLISSDEKGTKGFSKHLESVIKEKNSELKKVNDFLRANGIKVGEAERIDDFFIEYYYSCKVDGGFKEGTMRYWESAIKYNLKKRLNKYFTGR